MNITNCFRSSLFRSIIESLDLQIMDVGSRGGIDEEFLPAAWATTALGFEPEPGECDKLNRGPSGPWRAAHYLPVALGPTNGDGVLHIPGNPAGASLLELNASMLERFGYKALHLSEKTLDVKVLTLDSLSDRFGIESIDYIKIDAEGAELCILKSGTEILQQCLALKIETSFLEQRNKQPLMHEVCAFMSGAGFHLVDIRDVHFWRRRPLPAHPYVANSIVPYSRGVAAQCDLVFLREGSNVSNQERLIRLLMVSAIMGYFDYAVTIIRSRAGLETALSRTVGDCVAELGRVSKRIGRRIALAEIVSRVRSILPLLRSTTFGISTDGALYTRY
jgi:FkbM family methyltransferase